MGKKKKKQKLGINEARKIMDDYITKADTLFGKDKILANKITQKVRKVSMKNKVSMPTEIKRRICKNCHSLLVPGRNLRVRTKNGHVVYFCLECKNISRIPYDDKKQLYSDLSNK